MRTQLVALLMPVAFAAAVVAAPVPKAAPLPPPTEEQVSASKENLKEIGLAFHNYIDANNRFADDMRNKDGKPLLSWRVAILPYIEEGVLYNQFKLDEPWDSDNNKKLVEKMPKIYATVRVTAKAGVTFYQRFVGDTALFAAKGPRYTIVGVSLADGTSRTALVVEAGSPVTWTKPGDLPFDAKKPLPKLGGLFDGEFHVALCDGSVMCVKKDFDETELKNLVMPDDGNDIDFKKLEK